MPNYALRWRRIKLNLNKDCHWKWQWHWCIKSSVRYQLKCKIEARRPRSIDTVSAVVSELTAICWAWRTYPSDQRWRAACTGSDVGLCNCSCCRGCWISGFPDLSAFMTPVHIHHQSSAFCQSAVQDVLQCLFVRLTSLTRVQRSRIIYDECIDCRR